MYRSIFTEVVPIYIEPIIREGMEDGTIQTDQPREMAEVLVLLANLWVAPLFSSMTSEQLADRIRFFMNMLKAMGADLSEENVAKKVEQFRVIREEALQAGGPTVHE